MSLRTRLAILQAAVVAAGLAILGTLLVLTLEDALLAEVDGPQTAVEVYGASLLAIEVDTPAERDYLRRLAQALQLDPATVQRLHASLGAPG